ncbi:hypothetical protein [Subtercola endophyticus]|uniref:hypothetical protein n=1 Tax=Subtercola endophyticus TaxID=2895559 RepID=UPI001E2CE53C|nr:hypothetical protein [Subtercola endophyticus]UFS58951.1 hypothetical protein LQ955_18470 [Subtercola endophyticus]
MLAALWTIGLIVAFVGMFALIVFAARASGKRRAHPKPLAGGVRGSAQVVSVRISNNQANSGTGLCWMDVVLTGPGIAATAAKYVAEINTPTVPRPGMTLPASINPSNPQKFVILWGELPDPTKVGEARAQQIASELRARDGEQHI